MVGLDVVCLKFFAFEEEYVFAAEHNVAGPEDSGPDVVYVQLLL
jgi:hypothetical protein